MSVEPLIEVRDLAVDYRTGKRSSLPVVRDVNLDVYPDDSLALVGESGSGKTTLALAMLRLLPKLGRITSGSIRFRNRDGHQVDLLSLDKEAVRRFRWTEAAIVYQGAMNSLNPLIRVSAQFRDTARAHRTDMSTAQIDTRAEQLCELVQLEPGRVLPAYPHQLSGGMRQRVLIALSLLLRPQLLVLDEPTTALDILTQRSVVDTLRKLKAELRFAMIFVSHDLALAAELADRVLTMYGGRVVESASVNDAFYDPRHPYTIGLIKAVPPVTGSLPEIASIAGNPPGFGNLPSGCSFRTRCPYAHDVCSGSIPPLDEIRPGHEAACFFADQMHLGRKPVTAND